MAAKRQREPLKLNQLGLDRADTDKDGDVRLLDGDGDPLVHVGADDMDALCKWWLGNGGGEEAKPVNWRDITVTPGAGGSVTIRFQG